MVKPLVYQLLSYVRDSRSLSGYGLGPTSHLSHEKDTECLHRHSTMNV